MKHLSLVIIILTFTISIGKAQNKSLRKVSYWMQEGYGRGLSILDSNYIYYNLDAKTCHILAEGKLTDRFSIISETENQIILNPGGIVNYLFTRASELPQICLNTIPKDTSLVVNFDAFWQIFNEITLSSNNAM